LERGDLLDEYLVKLGIFRVELCSLELPNGLSKDDLVSAETPLRWCWLDAATARVEEGSCWRAQARSKEPEAEERDMVGEGNWGTIAGVVEESRMKSEAEGK
jgi:hypothetical protein